MSEYILKSLLNPESCDVGVGFAVALLAWYDLNARNLPWRDQPSPYRVWVSEIMLQQTRVDTVIPYFNRLIDAFPDVAALASANDEQLYKCWEGLGYYSRVRNMKKAAIIICERYGGIFPNSYDRLLSLPGFGAYTAGAVASIAFNEAVPAVDGNVLRVFSRLYADRTDIGTPAMKRAIEKQVISLLPPARAGDFNQALMDLGATVCLPNGNALCEICPVQSFCKGSQEGIVSELPVIAAKSPRKMETKTVFIIIYKDRVALRKRSASGLLASLWEFPNCDGILDNEDALNMLAKLGIHTKKVEPLPCAKHVFTHIEWKMNGFLTYAQSICANESMHWASADEIRHYYTLPSAFRAYTDVALKVLGSANETSTQG